MTLPTIENDPDLLDMFIKDMDRQSELWKPTNYWKAQCQRMQKHLARAGLAGFRKNWGLMRGVDLGPKQAGLDKQPVFANRLTAGLARRLPLGSRYEKHIDNLIATSNAANEAHIARELSLLYYLLEQGQYSGPICATVDDSGVGDPHLYEFRGRHYSSNLLHHICLLSILHRIGGTDDYQRFIEIGGGYGALPELLFKYHRGDIEYFVEVDIPPLVYVTTQYLKAVFPGRVVDYRDVRAAQTITAADIKGKILVIPPWSVPKLALDFDLFWNSASFQEMERDVVDNYLEFVRKTTANIFINTLTDGHRKGLGGQLEPISFDRLAGQIRSKGYAARQLLEDCIERSAYRSVLPRHSAALFTRDGSGALNA